MLKGYRGGLRKNQLARQRSPPTVVVAPTSSSPRLGRIFIPIGVLPLPYPVPRTGLWSAKLPLNTCRRLRMILTPSHWPCYSPGINFSGRRASPRLRRSGSQGQAAVISIIPVTCQTECELMRERGFHLQSFINPVGSYRLPHDPAKWDTAFI